MNGVHPTRRGCIRRAPSDNREEEEISSGHPAPSESPSSWPCRVLLRSRRFQVTPGTGVRDRMNGIKRARASTDLAGWRTGSEQFLPACLSLAHYWHTFGSVASRQRYIDRKLTYCVMCNLIWSHPPGSNRRPADYESAALPAEEGQGRNIQR